MARIKSTSTRLIGHHGRRAFRFLSSNWWRAGVLGAFLIGVVGYSGYYVVQYSEAASIEDQAKSICGAYGVKASPSTAKCIAQKVLAPNMAPGQFWAIDNIYSRESGYQWNATNHVFYGPGATAWNSPYGVAQSFPGSKYGEVYCAHGDGKNPNWWSNATCQMRWGINYMYKVYGSPEKAWTFWKAHSAY